MENSSSNSVQSLTARGSSRVHIGNSYNTTNHYHNEFDQDEAKKYLDALRSTDPREDKVRIEQTNGGLLKDSYTSNPQPDHIALTEDALRFFYFFSPVIKDYPLQTYASGLLFSPKESLIRHRFEKYTPDIFAKVPEIDDNWSPILGFFDFSEETSEIATMKFSSTSHMLVVATWDSESIIWQVSEDPVPEITKHENTVWLTPSPDGKWLAAITMQHSDEMQEPVL
ncbi:uncharacterized protein FRV6_14228 [Fusarium oxysporum]|uniref:NWD2 HET-s N-terminal domain-containing protein n=1 Tax=Fusarium oxysporum TaxID=5507 RepID=A0A2H3TZA8_FUSOX|nr:uncharacterized protein FRV6_14228 [Fusarium oxysporum]